MASAPDSPPADVPPPLPATPDPVPPPADSPPPSDPVPPPADSPPPPDPVPPPADSPPPPDVTAPPPSDTTAPPPTIASPEIPVAAPPPIVASSPPPTPPSPALSSPPEPGTSPPPTPPTSKISPPLSPPQASEPSPAIIPQGPPPSTSPPAPPTPSSSTPSNTLSPPPAALSPPSPSSSTPHLAPPTPADNSKPSRSTPTTPTTTTTPTPSGGQGVTTGVAVGVVAALVVIGFFMVIFCVRSRRRRRHDRYNSVYMLPSQFASSQFPTPQFPPSQDSGSSFLKQNHSVGGGGDYMSSSDSGIIANSQTWFSYEQLNIATNGFSSQNILGTGGFGTVYKGILPDGQVVAVKKLKDISGQGDREFKAEVETVSRVHHRYLVSLVGFCISDNHRLLVYEYVPNNTLQHHIHASDKPAMQWSLRVRAACGSARGIAYLHEDCHPKIIHRDIKTANILLDSNFDAKVADFGLAKLAGELELNTHVSTRVMGTFGYMAPEYASSGKLTEKSDVFSFGVVLLELITGRQPVDQKMPLGDESLVEWARQLMTDALETQDFSELADPRLEGNYDAGEMFRMIEAAAACVRHSASKRPKMSQVVRALDTINEMSDISNGMKPGQSGIYSSREQSAQIKMFQRMAFGSQDFSSSEHGNSQSGWARSGQASGAGGLV